MTDSKWPYVASSALIGLIALSFGLLGQPASQWVSAAFGTGVLIWTTYYYA